MTGPKVFATALLLYLATAGGSLGTTDAVVTYDLTKRMVEERSIALSGNLLGFESMRGVDGRFYSPFGIAQSVWNVPFYVAGRAASAGFGLRIGSPDVLPKAVVALGGAVAAALGVWATYSFALALFGGHTLRALVAALVLGVATAWWPYSKFGFNQPLAGLFVVLTLHGTLRGTRGGGAKGWRLAGLWWACALLTRHELALLLVPMAAFQFVEMGVDRHGWRRALLGVAPGALAGVAAWVAYNSMRFGNPIDTGLLRDSTPAFGSSVTAGLFGLLLSPQASVFLYSPVVILGVGAARHWWRTDRGAACLLGGTFVVFLLFYSQMGNWIGGRSYGGRYLVPFLPVLSIGAVPLLTSAGRAERYVAAAVCAASVLVQVPGVAVDFAKVRLAASLAASEPIRSEPNSLWLNTRAMLRDVPNNSRYLLGIATPPDVVPWAGAGDRTFSQRFAFSLDFWWLYLYYMRVVPAPLALGAGLALVTSAAALTRALAATGREAVQ